MILDEHRERSRLRLRPPDRVQTLRRRAERERCNHQSGGHGVDAVLAQCVQRGPGVSPVRTPPLIVFKQVASGQYGASSLDVTVKSKRARKERVHTSGEHEDAKPGSFAQADEQSRCTPPEDGVVPTAPRVEREPALGKVQQDAGVAASNLVAEGSSAPRDRGFLVLPEICSPMACGAQLRERMEDRIGVVERGRFDHDDVVQVSARRLGDPQPVMFSCFDGGHACSRIQVAYHGGQNGGPIRRSLRFVGISGGRVDSSDQRLLALERLPEVAATRSSSKRLRTQLGQEVEHTLTHRCRVPRRA